MVDIAALKKSRSSDLSKLQAKIVEETTPKTVSYTDDRFWKMERDKAGNASATIRFLQSPDGESDPYIKYLSYGFKGPNGNWYIERSLRTFKQPDPVYDLNGKLYASNQETDKLIAKNQRLVTNYVANILVINDPKHPENNGKVFLFKFGSQIHKIIIDKITPTFEDEEPVNVFSYWDGANLKLRMKNGENNRPNYLSSTWDNVSPLGSDEYITTVAESQYDLSEELAPEKYKSYAELKKRLDFVYGDSPSTSADSVASESIPTKSATKTPSIKAKVANTPPLTDEEDENYEEYFNSLLEES